MKRKKNIRQRGAKTHGWGSMKKHRGAGNRGGRGNAGSGKRADQNKPSFWNSKKPKRAGQKPGQDYFGKHGFSSIHTHIITIINVKELDRMLPLWLAEKKVQKTGDTYTVDLGALGYEKLLGTGRITKKARVIVLQAAPKAIEKIAAAGGQVTVQASDESPKDS